MKLSVDTDDPGYRPDFQAYRPYLDGEWLPDCVTIDEEAGTATVYMRGADGEFMLTRSKQSIKRKQIHGNMEIRRIDEIWGRED